MSIRVILKHYTFPVKGGLLGHYPPWKNYENKLRVYVLLWESERECARPQVCARVHSNKTGLTGENSCFRHRRLLQRCLHVLKMVQNVSRKVHCIYNMHWQRCRRKFVKWEQLFSPRNHFPCCHPLISIKTRVLLVVMISSIKISYVSLRRRTAVSSDFH